MPDNQADRQAARMCVKCGATLHEQAESCSECGHAVEHPDTDEDSSAGFPDDVLADSAQIRKQLTRSRTAMLEADVRALQERVHRLEARLAASGIPEYVPAEPISREVSPVPVAVAPAPEPQVIEVPSPAAQMPSDIGQPAPAPSGVPVSPETPLEPGAVVISPKPLVFPPPPSVPKRAPVQRPRDLESMISGRGMALAGGLALLLGAVFFLSLAFSRGWISPSARVVIGVIAATGMIVGGGRLFSSRQALFGHVLTAVGLGVLSLSMIAATRLYDLIPVAPGLIAVLVGALMAAAIAIRHNLQVVAAYGIVAVLAAPPLLGAEPNGVTIAFLGATLAGTTAIALYRNWSWLPSLALLLTAPQLAAWLLDDPDRLVSIAALGGYWLLHATAAGGAAFRVPETRLRPASAATLVANAALAVWGGFEILEGSASDWRGLFLLVLALAHGCLGGWFLWNRGDRDPFGMLAFGTGVAALTMAVPVQFGGGIVPVAWAAEAVALAWASSRLRNRFGAFAAALLGLLVISHLILIEYPLIDLFDVGDVSRPFIHAEGLTLAFVLLAIIVTDTFVRSDAVRRALTLVSVMLVTWAMPFELSGVALVGGWGAVAVMAALAERRLSGLNEQLTGVRVRDYLREMMTTLAPALPWGFAALHFLLVEARDSQSDSSFTDPAMGAALLLIGSAVAISAISRYGDHKTTARIAALAVAALLVPVELGAAATVVAWAALAGVAILARGYDESGSRAWLIAGGTLVVGGLYVTLSDVAPPERLFVDSNSRVDHPFFWSGASAALGSLVIVLAWAYRRLTDVPVQRYLNMVAGGLLVYLLSVGVVDYFQAQVGDVRLESLQKQAQVALSILWALIGGAAFAWGVVRRWRTLRIFALVLLGLTTAKVFIYDMASLDTSYRVLSLIGLGVLLMLSSYVYQRTVNSDTDHEPGGGALAA